MGSQATVVVVGPLAKTGRAAEHLTLEPLSLQQLVVQAAGRSGPDVEMMRTSA
jgi:hypothetical protein